MDKYTILNALKSTAYREGWQAGKDRKWDMNNPYSDQATDDNLRRGMGASPWWDTNYKPFIDWQSGLIDAKNYFYRKEIDAAIKKGIRRDN